MFRGSRVSRCQCENVAGVLPEDGLLLLDLLPVPVGRQGVDADGRERDRPFRPGGLRSPSTVNGQLSVIQPYLPAVRGIESPTFVLHRQRAASALFGTFEQVFDWLWERSEPV
jgi:hypothetical protein